VCLTFTPAAAMEDFGQLPYVRMAIMESMRLYPQPPILIRRQAILGGGGAGWELGPARTPACLPDVVGFPPCPHSLPLATPQYHTLVILLHLDLTAALAAVLIAALPQVAGRRCAACGAGG
jgi:hypothetical protein